MSSRESSAALPDLATKITVGSGKWTQQVAVASRLLFLLAMETKILRTIPSGSWKSSQYGWDIAPPLEPVQPELGRARLVARYLERFGPVTTTDIHWWTGLTKTRVNKALAQIEAVPVKLDSGEAWVHRDWTPVTATGVALLPGLDPSAMGYKDRDWYMGEPISALFDRNGNIGPTAWVDGRIVGGWAVNADAKVLLKVLETIEAPQRAALQDEVARLEIWLKDTPITPRFRTPLEKELVS